MKSFSTLTAFLFLLLIFPLKAEKIIYNDSWGKASISLVNSSVDQVEVNFSIHSFYINDRIINDRMQKVISLPGAFLPNDAGMPNLPGVSRYIAIPQGADVNLKVVDYRVEKMTGLEIGPAPELPFDTQDEMVYPRNEQVYASDAYYPDNPVLISSRKSIRGVDVVILGVTPFQYNPVTKELLIYRDIKIRISFNGGNGHFGEDRLRNRFWEPMLHDLILNHDMLPKRTFNTRSPSGQTKQRAVENVEYIIIVPDDPDFIAWGDSLRVFRNQQGISTGVVTTTEIGGNTFEAIESYVNDAYYNWETPPAAVLLLADYGNSGSTITSSPEEPHPYSGTYISDNYFADVDEDDLPDIVFSRITAQNETDLENTVKKILDYERHPPTNPDYYNHPVTAMGWQTERWFQLCSEIINGFWEHVLGKQPVRENAIYSGTPGDVWSTAENTETIVDYFGPNGLGYIPETPEHLTDWGGNATRINNDINSGAFMVQHRDHGSETGWGEPDYDINDLNDLDNNDLTFVFSVNCLTGKFNMDGECFVEAFHRRAKRALGLIGATQVSYSFVNDTYNWGMYDNLWPEFMPDETTTFPTRFILPSYGNAAGKYFLQASDWPYNTEDKEITYYLFHHHGGAYSMVYSEMPQNLTVSHDSQLQAGETTFTVTADEGSLIGLSVNGELIGSADGTGEPVTIEIEPQDPGAVMLVTVTKQNYYRYSSEVEIVNADGPHITVDSYTVDDSESGNNNQEADFNESFYLNVNAKNIGSETAFGVHAVLTTTDAYLTVSDSTHFYGDVATDQVVAGDTAFYLQAADDVPDQHSASCNVRFSDSQGGEWNSTLSLIINAPALAVEDLQIDDSAGGNNDGDLDEGETASFIIPAVNNGHADAPNTEATLTTESPYLTIENSSYTVGTLAAGDTVNTVFTVTADPGTPASTEAQLTYTVTSGAYTAQRIFTILIGERPVYLMSNETITLDDDAFFYDSGGKDNDYGTSESLTMTFYAKEGASDLRVVFTAFETIADYDKLYIYDGPNSSSPEVAGSPFSGTNSPGEIISTNSDHALTFRFRSNPAFTSTGWEAELYSDMPSAIGQKPEEVIHHFALRPNFPNPFNPSTSLEVLVPTNTGAQAATLTIYDVLGQAVRTLFKGKLSGGRHTFRWEGKDDSGHKVNSGIYYIVLRAGQVVRTQKALLVK